MSTSAPITDPRARRWAFLVKAASILVGGFLIAPYILTALGGLIGLIAAGVVMGVTWMLLPWAGSKAANLRIRLIKHEAAINPVESLLVEHKRQAAQLEERKQGVETMAGANRTLWQTIGELESEFPDSPELPQMKSDYEELKTLEAARRQNWQDAYIAHGEFAKEIKRASRLWDVSLAAAKARGLSGLSDDEWMSKLKTETSFDAIRTKLNTELSALSTENMQAEADRILKGRQAKNVTPLRTALPAASGSTIDIVAEAAKVKVAR